MVCFEIQGIRHAARPGPSKKRGYFRLHANEFCASIAIGMNQFLTMLSRAVLVLAFLQGQLALAMPGMAVQMGARCGQHVAAPAADHHHGRHQARSGTYCDHRSESAHQQAQHQTYGGDGGCDRVCQHDGCCSSCDGGCNNACGHCQPALATAFQALIPSLSEMLSGVSLLVPDAPPSPIFQPPRRSVQS